MFSTKIKIVALAATAAAGGAVLALAPAAFAVTAPSSAITNDPNASNGTLSFYNSSGAQISSGNDLTHLFDYALASTPGRSGATKATLYLAFPDHTKADSTTWFKSQKSLATTYPNSTAPAPLNASTNPLVALKSTDGNLASLLSTTDQDHTAGYDGILQVRAYDSGAGAPFQSSPFWASDIYYDQAANTWQQVYPKVATSTTLTASPSPGTAGGTVTLSATVSPTAAGSVQFKDGATNLGNAVTVNGSGVATTTTNTLAAGSHSLSAVFTPSGDNVSGSTGSTTLQVNEVPATSTVLALSGSYTEAGKSATLTANVTGPGSTANGAGTVAFYDNGATTPLAGTVTSTSAGTYVLQLPDGFTAGGHSVVAKFVPTDATQVGPSQSAAQSFSTASPVVGACAQPGSSCIDPQSIKTTIAAGTLVIDTPYTAANPLDVGTLALSADSSKFSGSATFNDIKVTDTRAGNLPWTAAALSTSLGNGSNHVNGVINGQNVGLTDLLVTKGTGFTGTVTTAQNGVPAAPVSPNDAGSAGLGGSTAHTIATTDHGTGTVTLKGTLTIQAPSSTEQGTYTGTITFTVG